MIEKRRSLLKDHGLFSNMFNAIVVPKRCPIRGSDSFDILANDWAAYMWPRRWHDSHYFCYKICDATTLRRKTSDLQRHVNIHVCVVYTVAIMYLQTVLLDKMLRSQIKYIMFVHSFNILVIDILSASFLNR